ncbi:hypothetical protein [Skermania piniformis]|uniref:Uncharacterized protein n=1 Tax=Skermania pinensis TaxID=39122 RepID=A0ABX8S3Y6_9ACTN|nr:hypothetical protein [Skermania piniformis]QXQ12535.1 hypothetical protein KV203_11170 [Skermania piniformis]
MTAEQIAQRLLDAQVEFVLAELDGTRFAEVVARDVDDVVAVGASMRTRDVVRPDDVVETVLRLLDQVGGSDIARDVVLACADAIYAHSAAEEYRLGDLVDRAAADALVTQVLSMRRLHDRALDRLTESPLVAELATLFVSKIVGDFVQQGRERAEKIPGVGSMFAIGQSAASRVLKASDRLVGDVAGKGAQYALRRTNDAIRDVLADPSTRPAVMQVWDLHADEPISGLRDYMSADELDGLLGAVREVGLTSRNKPYVREAVVECVDVFFARYGDLSLAELLPALGIGNDDIAAEILRFGPAILDAARASGALATLVRDRLEPFYTAESTLALLTVE